MWIAHFAPGLALKRMAPEIPLFYLALAGAFPDALFMLFAVLGIETMEYSDKSEDPAYRNPTGGPGSGCFPYDCDYPYTHSIAGQLIIALGFAAAVTLYVRPRRARASFGALTFAGLTHSVFDLAVHRHDIALVPSEPLSRRHGFPLFDYPAALFAVDLGIFVVCLAYYARTARPAVAGTEKGRKRAMGAYLLTALAATAVQADFAFFGVPGRAARFVHAPLFFVQILSISWALGLLDVASTGAGGLEKAKSGKAL